MMRDVEFLQSRMSKLEGSVELSHYLITVVNNKAVAQEAEKKQEPGPAKPGPEEQQPVQGSEVKS